MSSTVAPARARSEWAMPLMLGGGALLLTLFALTATNAAGAGLLWENAHWTVVAMVAAALGYLRYREASPDERPAHAAIAVGLALYVAGQVAWNLQVVLGLVTVPALSDLGFLLSALPIAWAFVHRLRRNLDKADRVAFALDAAIVATTMLLLVWMAYGSTAVVASDPLAGAILIAYPVAFLSASGIGALAALRARVAASWRGINPLLLGLAGNGIAWVLWLESAITEIPAVGSAVNYAFSVTWFVVGIGAYHLRLDRVGTRVLDRVATAAELLFPMLAIAAVLTGLVVAEVAHPARPNVATLLGAAAVVGLAVARQSLLLAERQRLAARDRELSLKERQARAEAERALASHQAGEARYRQVVDVFGRLGEQLSFAADEPTLIRGGVAALRKLVRSDAGDLLLANASQDRLVVASAWGSAARNAEELVEDLQPTSCLGIRRGSVYAVSDAADDLMLACPAHPIQRGSLLCVPMLALGQTIGVVHLEAAEPNAFSVDDEGQARRVAEQVALAIANARLVRTMESMALTDPLTRLHNARFFDPFLDRELASAERAGEPMGVIMIDLDHFKAFNDEHGHAAGDEALRAFARAAFTVLRDSDTLARYGGEEFVVAVRGAELEGAAAVAERLRAAVEGTSVEVGLGRYATITASFGVASTTLHGNDRLTLLRAADRAMYRAKRAGRNRVEVAGAPRTNRRAVEPTESAGARVRAAG